MLPTIEWSDYRRRIRDEHAAGWLTAAHYLVLVAIADLVASGKDQPTVACIAVWARCSTRTVRRARAIAEGRGLLAVEVQHDPAPEGSGRRRWQTANRYELTTPADQVRPKPPKSRGGQRVRPRVYRKEESGLTRGVDLLAAAQKLMTERLMAKRGARWSEPTGGG